MTIYQVKGRVLAVMVVILVVAFIMFMTQFYGTNQGDKVSFSLASQLRDVLKVGSVVTGGRNVTKTSTGSLYAIVFDAGSTGSRVHIFQFQTEPGSQLKLIKETFEENKPGLSAYADDPIKAALSLEKMMQLCTEIIPAHLYSSTPITLKATAGLRLLPEGRADNILNEVTSYLHKSPFRLQQDGVGIMDGDDEGVFSWLTVNFMLGFMSVGKEPVPALDLGGGSTQVTLTPTHKETVAAAPQDFMKNVSLFSQQYHIYTHSYLGLGLMSARFAITGGDKHADEDMGTFSPSGPCIQPGIAANWSFSGKVYTVKGANPDDFSYQKCEVIAKALTTSHVIPIREMNDKTVYVFSYFYDRAVDAGLVAHEGGVTRVVDFKIAAQKEFSAPGKESPFQALDLTYIYSLLHHGYQLEDNTNVHLAKKINDVEVSWGLGAAFPLLSSAGLAR